MRRCPACSHTKHESEFYGPKATKCKDCDNGRKRQTPERVLRNRAHHRAAQELVRRHRDEYNDLLDYFRQVVEEEAAILAVRSETTLKCASDEHPPAEVVLLRPGQRRAGQDAESRIAPCAFCANAHERKHRCPVCGAAPQVALAAAAIARHQR